MNDTYNKSLQFKTKEDFHAQNELCEDEDCQECCDHEWDFDEGGMCINCGAEGGYEAMADSYEEDR